MIFPEDDNGDALRRIAGHGDDLSRVRNVDFTIVFPDQCSAEKFAEHFRTLGYVASVVLSEVKQGAPWDVIVIKSMALSYEGVVNFEEQLQDIADTFGGQNDGWGCLSGPPKPSA